MGEFFSLAISVILVFLGGIIGLAILLAIGNGVIFAINAVIEGPKKLDYLVVVITPDILRDRVPEAVRAGASGGQVQAVPIVEKIIPDAVSAFGSGLIKSCSKRGNVSMIVHASPPTEKQQAINFAGAALAQSGVSLKYLNKVRVYYFASTAGSQCYAVAAGNIPSGPGMILVPDFS